MLPLEQRGIVLSPLCRWPSRLTLVAILAACGDSAGPEPNDDLFRRYVALGNSITAGVESDGINDSTQSHTYPVILAERAGAEFFMVRIRRPGCPPPLVGPAPLTAEREGGASARTCAGLVSPIPAVVQNLALPGAKIADVLTIPSGDLGVIYNQLFNGRTLVTVMADAQPSLVSVWLGNNDALNAGLSGDPGQLTPLAQFQASLAAVASAIADRTPARDAILIGVTNPQLAPVLQPGAYFWALKQNPETAGLVPAVVSDNCAPQQGPGAPNPLASNLVSFRIVGDAGVTAISCADDAPYLLNPSEQQAISTRVSEFNAAIRAAAHANGWIYVDSDSIIASLLADPNRVRKCQGIGAATTAEEFQTVVRSTCPSADAPNFFGSVLSFDGIHPSAEGHRVLADVIAAALVAKHGGLALGARRSGEPRGESFCGGVPRAPLLTPVFGCGQARRWSSDGASSPAGT